MKRRWRRLPLIAAAAGACLALGGTGSPQATVTDPPGGLLPGNATLTYTNPVYVQGKTARDEVRDPCILREGDTYYLVFTTWPFRGRDEKHLHDPDNGSSPGIKLYSSHDLKTWKFETWLVKSSALPNDCPYKHRFQAPKLSRIGSRFYLSFTADNWLEKRYNPAGSWGTAGYAFVGVAEKVAGPYRHITYIPDGAADTTLFGDTDGQVYALIPFGDLYVQKIDLSGIDQDRVRLVGERKKIVTAKSDDIHQAASPDYLEGPWIVKVGSRYFLFYAALYRTLDVSGYWTGVAYADSPLGPWQKDPRGRIFWGGHLAVFDGPDGREWFSYRGEQFVGTRGFLCIDPFDIDTAGTVQPTGPTFTEQTLSVFRIPTSR